MASCRRPQSDESFVLSSKAAEMGGYIFDVDMADSLCTYDMSFYARVDHPRNKETELQDYPMYLVWTSPSGTMRALTVYMDMTAATSPTYFSKQIVIPFMEDVVPEEFGMWQLKVSANEVLSDLGLRGLGLVVKRNTH
ncbi:MAG: hypothetical protein MJZ16_00055 [Bacteroidales bacterium]|nr:hypothetical protein [Bacteroidales bacterium]